MEKINETRPKSLLLSVQPDPDASLDTFYLGFWDPNRSKDPCSFLVGRSADCDAIFLDSFISRKHATISLNEETKQWALINHKSLNGVSVNKTRVPPEVCQALKDGDVISFGPSRNYLFLCEEVSIQFKLMTKSVRNELPKDQEGSLSLFLTQVKESLKKAQTKISTEEQFFEQKVEQGRQIQDSLRQEKENLEKELQAKHVQFELQQKIERDNFDKTLSANQEENARLIKEFEQKLDQEKSAMLEKSKSLEAEMKQKVEEQECRMQNLLLERDKMIEMLQIEKEKTENQILEERKKFDAKVTELEGAFKNTEKEKSQEYKDAIAKLQEEFAEKTRQNQIDLEEAISREKAEKEAEKEKMKEELQQYRSELAKLKEEAGNKRKHALEEEKNNKKKKKEESRLNLYAKCSEELKCTICDELFISPFTLNCGHVYCKYCIDQWKLKCRSGGFTCPNCREKITSQNKSLHLENLIEALFKDASTEIKSERKKLVEERKALQSTSNASSAQSLESANPRRSALIASSARAAQSLQRIYARRSSSAASSAQAAQSSESTNARSSSAVSSARAAQSFESTNARSTSSELSARAAQSLQSTNDMRSTSQRIHFSSSAIATPGASTARDSRSSTHIFNTTERGPNQTTQSRPHPSSTLTRPSLPLQLESPTEMFMRFVREARSQASTASSATPANNPMPSTNHRAVHQPTTQSTQLTAVTSQRSATANTHQTLTSHPRFQNRVTGLITDVSRQGVDHARPGTGLGLPRPVAELQRGGYNFQFLTSLRQIGNNNNNNYDQLSTQNEADCVKHILLRDPNLQFCVITVKQEIVDRPDNAQTENSMKAKVDIKFVRENRRLFVAIECEKFRVNDFSLLGFMAVVVPPFFENLKSNPDQISITSTYNLMISPRRP